MMGFQFEGKPGGNLGEMFSLISAIAKEGDKGKAKRLISAYAEYLGANSEDEVAKADPEFVARRNVGYLAGYAGQELRELIFEVFDVQHPVFGTATPSPTEAFVQGASASSGKDPHEIEAELDAARVGEVKDGLEYQGEGEWRAVE